MDYGFLHGLFDISLLVHGVCSPAFEPFGRSIFTRPHEVSVVTMAVLVVLRLVEHHGTDGCPSPCRTASDNIGQHRTCKYCQYTKTCRCMTFCVERSTHIRISQSQIMSYQHIKLLSPTFVPICWKGQYAQTVPDLTLFDTMITASALAADHGGLMSPCIP